jgi:hypothetical protein
MLSLANDLVARAARLVLAGPHEPALWTISTSPRLAGDRVVGSLICEAGAWRLSWFAGTDPRLANYAGPVDGDVEALAAALSARLGAPVELQSQPV